MTVRTKGNAKWLFQTDVKDGFKRRIPNQGHFGMRNIPSLGLVNNFHIGVDYGANIGEKLTSYDVGTVLKVGGHSDYGKQVFIYFHKIDRTGHYAHMNKVNVKVGQTVKAQEVIGESGNTGKSGGPHLHFSFGKGKITDTSKSHKWEDFEKFNYQANLLPQYRPKPQATSKRYINIHKGRKYGTYAMNVSPVSKNISQWLRPDNLGGMSYEIQATTKDPNVFIIETRDFGKRQIFLDKSRAIVTDKPLYKVYGKTSVSVAPKPQSIKNGSKVKCTASKDIHGANLDKSMFNGKKVYTVMQVGRNGNNNHILLKEVMTWVNVKDCKLA